MKQNLKQTLSVVCVLIACVFTQNSAFSWGRFDGGHHPAYGGRWARPAPVVVHDHYVRGGGGCIGCGVGIAAVAGLVTGVVVGTAIANSSQPNYNPPPVEVQPTLPPVGTEVATLPPGCQNMAVNGGNFYQCGPVWYQPYFGGNGVYYTVVPNP